MPRPVKPLPEIGTQFGRWTVISEEVQIRKHGTKGHKFMRVQCRCGSKNWVALSRLRGGYSNSCGCITREKHMSFMRRRAPLPKTFEA